MKEEGLMPEPHWPPMHSAGPGRSPRRGPRAMLSDSFSGTRKVQTHGGQC